MAVEVGEGLGIVANEGVEIERLGIGEIGVGNRLGGGGLVGI
jgi:hypothetical protein